MMIVLPWPTRWPECSSGSVPPIMTVGSRSAAILMCVHIEVVVVLPWVPAMHSAFR